MKYCVIVPDGAADASLAKLEDKTPLDVARTPSMDRAAQEGLLGLAKHVPPRMTAGSSVAMISVVGYNPIEEFTGRAPLEAADLNIKLEPRDWAIRCNLVTVSDDTLMDFTAGHIATEEAAVLIEALNAELGTDELTFYPGLSYRHILAYRGWDSVGGETVPPHDIVGESVRRYLPRGRARKLFSGLMERSRAILEPHEINQVRVDLGKNPANMIWLWGQGKMPKMETFESRFGLRGAVISAVNLVRGIGRIIGWDVITVPGATGYVDTDYAAKGRYAVDALNKYDLVLIHVEAPDEASHECDLKAKIRALEQIDREIVGPVMAAADTVDGLRVLIMPDHVTSVEDGKHKRGPVPIAMWGEGIAASSRRRFTELDARGTDVEFEQGHHVMGEFLGQPVA